MKSSIGVTADDYRKEKTLLFIYQKKLYLIAERPQKWTFYTDIKLDDETQKVLKDGTPTTNSKALVIRNYLKVEKAYDLATVKDILIDENGLPLLELEFAG